MCGRSDELLLFGWRVGAESTGAVISQGNTAPHATTAPPAQDRAGATGPDVGGLLWGQAQPGSSRGTAHQDGMAFGVAPYGAGSSSTPGVWGRHPSFLAAGWQRLCWRLPRDLVHGWHCLMSPHGTPGNVSSPPVPVGGALGSHARLFPVALPVTLCASPAPGTALPQHGSGWAAAAGP